MGVAGRTAPGSGMEHTVSHLLEMAERPGVEAPLHGAKVGALSVLAAMLWARVRTVARAGGLRALRFPAAEELEPRVRAAFAVLDPSGRVGEACWRDYARKLERWNDARDELETLWQRWPAFDAELDRLLASPERLVAALRAARAPVRLTQLGVRDRTARWALAHGHLMRDRFSVADLAFFMGIWDSADVDALLVAAARLGAGLVIEFVFMLTRDDVTVGDAADVLASLRESGLRYVGFKDIGPPPRGARRGHRGGARRGHGGDAGGRVGQRARTSCARCARRCDIGVDWVLGGTHATDGVEILGGAVKYCPFAGTIVGPPERPARHDRGDRRRTPPS